MDVDDIFEASFEMEYKSDWFRVTLTISILGSAIILVSFLGLIVLFGEELSEFIPRITEAIRLNIESIFSLRKNAKPERMNLSVEESGSDPRGYLAASLAFRNVQYPSTNRITRALLFTIIIVSIILVLVNRHGISKMAADLLSSGQTDDM